MDGWRDVFRFLGGKGLSPRDESTLDLEHVDEKHKLLLCIAIRSSERRQRVGFSPYTMETTGS